MTLKTKAKTFSKGGFQQIYVLIASIIVGPSCLIEFKNIICNKVRKSEFKSNKGSKKKRKESSGLLDRSREMEESGEGDNSQIFSELHKHKRKSKKLGWREKFLFMLSLGFIKSKKIKKIENSFVKLSNYLDVINLLKNIRKFEKINDCLLKKYQLDIIEILPSKSPPSKEITQNKKSNVKKKKILQIKHVKMDQTNPKMKSLSEALDEFRKVIYSSEKTDVDERIMEHLNANGLHIFSPIQLRDKPGGFGTTNPIEPPYQI
jgi:hypothetical protein